MTVRDTIARLEGLLDRVQRNARAPRVRAPHPAPAPAEPSAERGGGAAAPAAPQVQPREASPPPPAAKPLRAAEEVSSVAVEDFEDVDVELLEGEEFVEISPDVPSVPPAAAPAPAASAVPPSIERGWESEPPAPPESARRIPAEPARPPAAADTHVMGGVIDIDFDDVEDVATEEPPASSRRAKLPADSMDAALTDAAEQLEGEREVPIKTPPPESGPQEAVPPPQALQAPPVPDVDELLERPMARVAERTPSPAEVEIAEAEPPPVSAERTTVEARLEPEVTRRPATPAAEAATFLHAAQRFEPKSFLELLDASLELGG